MVHLTCGVGALVVATLNENGASFLGTSWGTGRFPNPNCGGVACTFSLFPKENTDEVGCFNVPPSGALVCPNPNRPEDAEVGFPVDNSLFFIVLLILNRYRLFWLCWNRVILVQDVANYVS